MGRVHGGFGTPIALGIRVGQDAQKRLDAGRRELEVTRFDRPATPCACVADGVTIAVSSSPGQGTLAAEALNTVE
jgi:formylmethanofuran dehydrogenase subunit E